MPQAVKDAAETMDSEIRQLQSYGQVDYFPEVFKGKYKILDNDGHIVASGETAKQVNANFEVYLAEHPDGKGQTYHASNDFVETGLLRKELNPEIQDSLRYLGTVLSKKEFSTLVGKVSQKIREEYPTIGSKNATIDLKGIAVMEGQNISSNFLLRKSTHTKGDYQDPFRVLSAYVVSMEHKLNLEAARVQAMELSAGLKRNNYPMASTYIKWMVDSTTGRYDWLNSLVDTTIGTKMGAKPFLASRWLSKGQSLEAKLKLGYAPVKVALNRLGGVAHILIKENFKDWANSYRVLTLPNQEIFLGKKAGTLTSKMAHDIVEEFGNKIGMDMPLSLTGIEDLKAASTSIFKPLGLYNRAELKSRPESLITSYIRARKAGHNHVEAIEIGVEAARLTQGLYNTAALPVLIGRGGISAKSAYQFKQYLMNEVRYMSQLTPKQWALYIPYISTMAGTRGLWLTTKSLIGPALIAFGVNQLADNLVESVNRKSAPDIKLRDIETVEDAKKFAYKFHRGLPGALNIDLSAPATWQIPTSTSDWVGPLYKDIYKTMEMTVKYLNNGNWLNEEIDSYIRQLAPVGYRMWQGYQAIETGEVRIGFKRKILGNGKVEYGGALKYPATMQEGFTNIIGAMSIEQSRQQDTISWMIKKQAQFTAKANIVAERLLETADPEKRMRLKQELATLKGYDLSNSKDVAFLNQSLNMKAEEQEMTKEQRVWKRMNRNIKAE